MREDATEKFLTDRRRYFQQTTSIDDSGTVEESKRLCVQNIIKELKKTTTATATSLNKRFNEQNNACARAL